MSKPNFSKTTNLEHALGYGPQVAMAMKAWNFVPPQRLGRTERLRQRLIGLKVRSFGLKTGPVRKATDQYDRHLITQYIRHGGEYFYKTFKSPPGTSTLKKCKPYRRPVNG